MAGPLGNRFQPRNLMNMGGSQEAARRAFLERKRLEEQQAAMLAAKEALALGARTVPSTIQGLGSRLDPSTTIGRADDPRLTGTPAVAEFNRGVMERNFPVLQKNLNKGKLLFSRGQGNDRPFDIVKSVRNLFPTAQVDEFSESNIPFFTGTGIGGAVADRSLKTPPSAPAAPIIPVGARARHHPGFDQYAYTGKPNRTNPFSSELLADLRKPEEDEFMSWDNKMFLLSLLAGMQGGKPPTPYGTAVGGGNKAWATLPSMRMS